jgi:hypothetical protein
VSHGSGLCLPERRAPALPRVPQLRTSPPCRGGLRRCHVATGHASPRGELRCCHVPHGPQRTMEHMNKERHNCLRHAARLSCVQSMALCYRGACKACGHVAIVWFNSATQSQLTTSGHNYSGDTTRQYGTTALTMFSITGWGDRTTPCC